MAMQSVLISAPTVGDELVKAKGVINQFINSCSHSLKGPLRSITGVSGILREAIASGNEDPMVYIDMINESVLKMEALLKQFEHFLETSKTNLHMDPVAIDDMVGDVIRQVEKETPVNGVAIEVKVNVRDHVFVDQNALRVVLFHLIQNAMVFRDQKTAKRKITVSIRADKNSLAINVIDNGDGIPANVASRVYELFFRGSEKSIGSGAGLFIVQEVLKKIGGTISFDSTENIGSDFFVWMPNRTSLNAS
jgi:signal transduction histidine kinase